MYMHTAWTLNNCRVKLVEVVPVQLADLNDQKLRSALITAAGVSPEDIDEWTAAVEAGNAEGIVSLIVALSPSIAEIDFACFRASGKWELVARMFKHSISLGLEKSSPRFQSLRHVRLKPNLHENVLCHSSDTADILSLFYLPNIQYLAISIPSRAKFAWPMDTAPPPTRLAFLKLYRVREYRGLRTILAVCPALESFRFKWLHHPGFDQPHNSRVADLDEIALAIVSVTCSETLNDLKIDPTCKAERDFETWSEAQPPPVDIRGSLQALSQLPNVEVLWLPWVFLVGMGRESSTSSPGFIAKVLPRSIEEFTLADDFPISDNYSWEQVEIIAVLVAELKNSGSFAAFKRLELLTVPRETRRTHAVDPDFRMLKLRRICKFDVGYLHNRLESYAFDHHAHDILSGWEIYLRPMTREEMEESDRLEEENERYERDEKERELKNMEEGACNWQGRSLVSTKMDGPACEKKADELHGGVLLGVLRVRQLLRDVDSSHVRPLHKMLDSRVMSIESELASLLAARG